MPEEKKNQKVIQNTSRFSHSDLPDFNKNLATRKAFFLKQEPQAKGYGQVKNFLFILFLCVLAITNFTKDRFKSAREIAPEVLEQPRQTEAEDKRPISFQKAGFNYILQPLYDYEISGLVMHNYQYDRWFSLSRTDKLFTTDLCLTWGGNITNKAYQNSSLSIRQDSRFCWVSFSRPPALAESEMSNNHLLIYSDQMEKEVKKISTGDQVQITGKLVNVKATAVGKTEQFEPAQANWNSSTARTDTGAGACEIIYLESVKILKKGNECSHFLFSFSWYGLLAVAFWAVFDFFRQSFSRPKEKE